MSLSTPARTALQRVADPQGLLWLLTITGDGVPAPVRLVSDTRELLSRGHTFIALPFEVVPPQEASKEEPRAQLRIDNVGREFMAVLEALPMGAELTALIELVYRATPNTVERAFEAPLGQIRADVFTVTATVGHSEMLRRPAVNVRFDPFTAPGLFPD